MILLYTLTLPQLDILCRLPFMILMPYSVKDISVIKNNCITSAFNDPVPEKVIEGMSLIYNLKSLGLTTVP
jgi:hypothetical protein